MGAREDLRGDLMYIGKASIVIQISMDFEKVRSGCFLHDTVGLSRAIKFTIDLTDF
jgi:hypothetical protein